MIEKMQRTRVKICGITRPQDAVMASTCGTDAIGLNFHPASPRFISVETAREILESLPPFVTPVGLFVDAEIDHILSVASDLGLQYIQLHGHESPAILNELGHLKVIKAIRVERATFTESLQQWRSSENLHAILLETASKLGPGGTGIANDWEFILERKRTGDFEGLPPIMAAGGLTPDTVGKVVRSLAPFMVDVSSGVESAPGIKSGALVSRFIEQVEIADRS